MKKFLALLVAMILLLSMVACNNGGDDKVATIPDFDSGKTVKLTIGAPGGDQITPSELFEMFEKKYPNIELTVDKSPWGDYEMKLAQQLAAKKAADVFLMDSGNIATFGAKGLLVNVADKVSTDFNTDEYTALDAGADGKGNIWGMPHGLNSVAILYNKKMFDDAGLSYPEADWTWEEMLDIAEKLTEDKDGDGKTDVYGLIMTDNITQGWLPAVLATGGSPVTEDRTQSNFDDPKTIEGLKLYKKIADMDIMPNDEVRASFQGSASVMFTNDVVAMVVAQAGEMTAIDKLKYEGFEYDAQYMPVGYDGVQKTIYVPNLWAINASASPEAVAAAWEWIKFYESEEAQQIIGQKRLAGFPIKKSALDKVADNVKVSANISVFYDKINENGVTLFENACWAQWVGVVSGEAGALLRDTKPFDEVIKTIQSEVERIHRETYGK